MNFRVHLFFLFQKQQLQLEVMFYDNLDHSFLGQEHLHLALILVCIQLNTLGHLYFPNSYMPLDLENFDFMTYDAFLPLII